MNESEKITIKKDDFKNVLSAIISNFKKQAFEVSKDNVARAFITLHSFIGNTTPKSTQFPEEKIENLYNALFSEYRNGKEAVPPKISYAKWKEKMADIYARDNNSIFIDEIDNINEEDKLQYAIDNTIKGVGDAALLAALSPVIGIFGAAVVSTGAKAIFTAISRRFERKGYTYANTFSKFLDCFRDTIDSMTDDLQKIVTDNEYSDAQMNAIDKYASNINSWWTNLLGSIETQWNDSDTKVSEFMKMYLDSMKIVAKTDFEKHNELKNLTSADVENALRVLIDNININAIALNDKEAQKELMKTFCLFSLMGNELSDISPKLKAINEYVEEMYNLLFSKYNEYGKKLETPKISRDDLVAFFNSREKYIDASVKRNGVVTEAENIEDGVSKAELKDMEKALDRAIDNANLDKDTKDTYKQNAKTLGAAVANNSKKSFQSMLYDISIWTIDILAASNASERAEKAGKLFGKIVDKFTTKFVENTTDPLINAAIGNIGNKWVLNKLNKIWENIKRLLENNNAEIEQSLERGGESVKKIEKIISTNDLANECFVMTFKQFVNESKKTWKN